MLDSVKKALDDKVAQYTSYSYAMTVTSVREIRLLVNTGDKKAHEYCSGIINHPGIRAQIHSIDSASKLEDLFDDLRDRAEDSDNPAWTRQFLLYVTSDPETVFHVKFTEYLEYFRELNYYLLYLSRKEPAQAPPDSFMQCLNASPRDIYSGRMLILDAGVSAHPLSLKNLGLEDGKIWYRLRTKEFSSIKEEILEQLYSELQPQLQGEAPTVISQKLIAAQNRFSSLISELQGSWRSYPTAAELPLAGYDMFCRGLSGKVPSKASGFGPAASKGRQHETGVSIAQALSVLFGVENNLSRPEFLRKRVAADVIPGICRTAARNNRNLLNGFLLSSFTLFDICSPSGIAAWTSGQKNRLQVQADQLDAMIGSFLNGSMLYLSSLSPDDIFSGLEQYFIQWNKYIDICFWKEWWGCVSEFISEIADHNAQEFNTLVEICEYIKWEIDYKKISLNTQHPIRSVEDVLKRIRGAAALRTYSEGDLSHLMERESSLVIDTLGDQGDIRRRPVMCMLAKGQNGRSVKKRVQDLKWVQIPVTYVPESVVYIMRISRVLSQEVRDDHI